MQQFRITANHLTDIIELLAPPSLQGAGQCVVLDPGHGGYDPGAVGPNGTKEKDIALLVAMAVGHRLREAGIKTAMTRATDTFVSLADRTTLANKRGDVDCFVSIHLNAAANRKASGVEVFHYPGSQEGKLLSSQLLGELLTITIQPKSRGVKDGSFYVLRHTRMPAALVELDFLSNPIHEELFNRPDVLAQYAAAISDGILKYLSIK